MHRWIVNRWIDIREIAQPEIISLFMLAKSAHCKFLGVALLGCNLPLIFFSLLFYSFELKLLFFTFLYVLCQENLQEILILTFHLLNGNLNII